MKFSIALLFILLFSHPAFAQTDKQKAAEPEKKSEPTLSETSEWLERNMPAKAVYAGKIQSTEVVKKITEASFTKCMCAITSSEEFLTRGQFTIRNLEITKIVVSAVSLNPDSIEVKSRDVAGMSPQAFYLVIATNDDKKVIQVETYREQAHFGKSKDTKMADRSSFMFDSRENAERIANAFRHLIRLCRTADKKEPF